jgi:hypothetical protein
MVSVVVRHTLVQTLTPDEMRGPFRRQRHVHRRVQRAGRVESGTVAHYIVRRGRWVTGGIGTILVVAGVAWLFPGVRRYGRLDSARRPPEIPARRFISGEPGRPREKPCPVGRFQMVRPTVSVPRNLGTNDQKPALTHSAGSILQLIEPLHFSLRLYRPIGVNLVALELGPLQRRSCRR